MTNWYRIQSDKFELKIYLQPGAKRNEVIGIIHDELKIKLNAPAIEGRANQALIKFLAKILNIPQSHIQIKSGEKSRHKCVLIQHSLIKPECLLMPNLA